MRTSRSLLLFVAASLVLALGSVPATATPSPFVGAWEGTDVFDGSNLQVQIGGGEPARFRLYDDYAFSCEDRGYGAVPAMALGWGTVEEDTITVTSAVWCLAVRGQGRVLLFEQGEDTWTYDPATDTLSDEWGNTLHRKGGGRTQG